MRLLKLIDWVPGRAAVDYLDPLSRRSHPLGQCCSEGGGQFVGGRVAHPVGRNAQTTLRTRTLKDDSAADLTDPVDSTR